MIGNLPMVQRTASLDELRPLLSAQPLSRWLSDAECELAERFRDQGRRMQWLAGRWIAKALITEHIAEQLDGHLDGPSSHDPLRASRSVDRRAVFIQSSDAVGRSIRPRVYVRGRLQHWSLSISHSDTVVYAALATRGGVSIGVDVVELSSPNRRLLDLWMTTAERRSYDPSAAALRSTQFMSTQYPWCAARVWSVKEAAYKAVNRGESFVPGQLEVARDASQRVTCQLPAGHTADNIQIDVREQDGHFFALAATQDQRRAERSQVPNAFGCDAVPAA